MKNSIFLVAAFLISSGSALASSLTCSSANGATQLQVGRYEGGAAPRPGQRVRWSDLTHAGVKYENVEYFFRTTKMYGIENDSMYHRETFVGALAATTGDGVTVEAVVLCESAEYIGPPRP